MVSASTIGSRSSRRGSLLAELLLLQQLFSYEMKGAGYLLSCPSASAFLGGPRQLEKDLRGGDDFSAGVAD